VTFLQNVFRKRRARPVAAVGPRVTDYTPGMEPPAPVKLPPVVARPRRVVKPVAVRPPAGVTHEPYAMLPVDGARVKLARDEQRVPEGAASLFAKYIHPAFRGTSVAFHTMRLLKHFRNATRQNVTGDAQPYTHGADLGAIARSVLQGKRTAASPLSDAPRSPFRVLGEWFKKLRGAGVMSIPEHLHDLADKYNWDTADRRHALDAKLYDFVHSTAGKGDHEATDLRLRDIGRKLLAATEDQKRALTASVRKHFRGVDLPADWHTELLASIQRLHQYALDRQMLREDAQEARRARLVGPNPNRKSNIGWREWFLGASREGKRGDPMRLSREAARTLVERVKTHPDVGPILADALEEEGMHHDQETLDELRNNHANAPFSIHTHPTTGAVWARVKPTWEPLTAYEREGTLVHEAHGPGGHYVLLRDAGEPHPAFGHYYRLMKRRVEPVDPDVAERYGIDPKRTVTYYAHPRRHEVGGHLTGYSGEENHRRAVDEGAMRWPEPDARLSRDGAASLEARDAMIAHVRSNPSAGPVLADLLEERGDHHDEGTLHALRNNPENHPFTIRETAPGRWWVGVREPLRGLGDTKVYHDAHGPAGRYLSLRNVTSRPFLVRYLGNGTYTLIHRPGTATEDDLRRAAEVLAETPPQPARLSRATQGLGAALRELGSKNQQARERVARQLLSEAGEPGAVTSVIAHHPEHGFRASVLAALATGDGYARDASRYLGAWHGSLTQEPRTVAFHAHEDGPDKLHIVSLPTDAATTADALRNLGVHRFSLQPRQGATRAFIYDEGSNFDFTNFAGRLNGRAVHTTGTGQRLGEGSSAYRDAIRAIDGSGASGATAASAGPRPAPQRLSLARLRPGAIRASDFKTWRTMLATMPTDKLRRGVFADWLEERGHHHDQATLDALRSHEGPMFVTRHPASKKVVAVPGAPIRTDAEMGALTDPVTRGVFSTLPGTLIRYVHGPRGIARIRAAEYAHRNYPYVVEHYDHAGHATDAPGAGIPWRAATDLAHANRLAHLHAFGE